MGKSVFKNMYLYFDNFEIFNALYSTLHYKYLFYEAVNNFNDFIFCFYIREPPSWLEFLNSNRLGGFFIMEKDFNKNKENLIYKNLNDNFREFAEYILSKKYFVNWIISENKVWNEEVSKEKYILAVEENEENNSNPINVPYYTECKYYAKLADMEEPVEIPKDVYELINGWQTTDFNHYRYITRRYKYDNENFDIEDVADDTNIAEEVANKFQNEDIEKLMQRNLTKKQFQLLYKIVFENKNQSEIARDLGVSRQWVNSSLQAIRKKLKKFLKNS